MVTLNLINRDIQFQKISNATALKQRLKNRLSLFLNEWFLDTSAGVNWFSVSKGTDSEFIKNLVERELRREENITAINSIEVTLVDSTQKVLDLSKPIRSAIINFSVNTVFGIVVGSV